MIIIVTGLTRSGLSVTMQMLHAGGFPCAGEPPAFEPYPFGIIPWNKVDGQAVKLVDGQRQLPPRGDYRVIRLRRDLTQQARSFNQFVGLLGGVSPTPERVLTKSFRRSYKTLDQWVVRQSAGATIDFEEIMLMPSLTARKLETFLGVTLDINKMVDAVVVRTSLCHDGLLELELLK